MQLNLVVLAGHLTQDPDLRFTPDGKAVCSLRIAANESWTGKDGMKKDRVLFIDAALFGATAEAAKKWLTKGRECCVTGKLQQDDWTDKQGNKRTTIKINAQSWTFVGSDPNRQQQQQQETTPAAGQQAASAPQQQQEDDLPF